jgi:pantetheine-phosphate adenylyltransferase
MVGENARIAIFPGSFDPLTLGHEDVARRALLIADRLIVAVAHHPSSARRGMFAVSERLEMMRGAFGDEPAIEVAEFDGLLVNFARERGASIIVRGVRGPGDLEYEIAMAQMNRALSPGLETIFMAPSPGRSYLSASLVREVAGLGGEVSAFVSPAILRRILDRTGNTDR